MKSAFYQILRWLTRLFGPGIFEWMAKAIAIVYFLFRSRQAKESKRVYAALYPHKSRWYHSFCVLKQYLNFTTIHLDRIILQSEDRIEYTSQGWEHLQACIAGGTGAVILMSHQGNWELAAHLMKQKENRLRLLLYMGRRTREQIESIQKAALTGSGVRIIAVDENQSSPFDLLEGVRFLQSGGVVSMTGDTLWHAGQRFVKATFLNHTIHLPDTPHLMAMLAGTPLMFFFSHRTGKNRYHFTLSDPYVIEPAPRQQRGTVIAASVQHYAERLEASLREYPFQWYHFEPFLRDRRS